MKHYHYIFTGSGLAALMTVYKMAKSGKFKKTILLLDENQKTNDHCLVFLANRKRRLGTIHFKKWDSALFANADFKRI
jgi:lycopene beta-cyclase